MITKICKKCETVKKLEEFISNKTCKFGVTNTCKICNSKRRHLNYLQNKNKVLQQSKTYYENNKKEVLSRMQDYYCTNKEKIVKRTTKYQTNRRKIDTFYKAKTDIRALIRDSFRRTKHKKNSKTVDILGCTIEQLKQHLEAKFQPGMTWDNHSQNGWHIDHIIPISTAKTPEDIIRLNHYTNLQPLWAADNLKKSNKILADNHV